MDGSSPALSLYSSASEAALRLEYVGQRIQDVPAPGVIIDAAVARRNCESMLETAKALNIDFRAHIKTHKTVQLTKLQIGENARTVRLVASTVAEIEHLLPWLLDCKSQGREVNVLYGLPILPSSLPRLARITRILGAETVGVFVDHASHIDILGEVDSHAWPGEIPIWVNIDVGYHREGATPGSEQLREIAVRLGSAVRLKLAGIYTHMGHSYGVSSPEEALDFMSRELEGIHEGAMNFLDCVDSRAAVLSGGSRVTISFGATPTATSTQNLLDHPKSAAFQRYRDIIDIINVSFAVEIHAGVYPLMDMQQLATRARPAQSSLHSDRTILSFADLGLRTLVEVASVYPDRGEKPEALIAAGSIVLGREPCKSYPGWGVVSPWPAKSGHFYDSEGTRTGWIVGRISQEHGVLTWEGKRDQIRPLEIGEKLLIWPNHACIAGVNFGWYLIVDSDHADPDKIVDVWVRCRGW